MNLAMDQRIKELERKSPRDVVLKEVEVDKRGDSRRDLNQSTNATVNVCVFSTYLLCCLFISLLTYNCCYLPFLLHVVGAE